MVAEAPENAAFAKLADTRRAKERDKTQGDQTSGRLKEYSQPHLLRNG